MSRNVGSGDGPGSSAVDGAACFDDGTFVFVVRSEGALSPVLSWSRRMAPVGVESASDVVSDSSARGPRPAPDGTRAVNLDARLPENMIDVD